MFDLHDIIKRIQKFSPSLNHWYKNNFLKCNKDNNLIRVYKRVLVSYIFTVLVIHCSRACFTYLVRYLWFRCSVPYKHTAFSQTTISSHNWDTGPVLYSWHQTYWIQNHDKLKHLRAEHHRTAQLLLHLSLTAILMNWTYELSLLSRLIRVPFSMWLVA